MQKASKILVWLGVLSLALVTYGWAQPATPQSGRGQKGGMGMRYDPQNLATVSGVVAKVTTSKRRSKGVHLQLKTDKGNLIVALGPSSYLQEQKMNLAVGDKIEVTGTRLQHPRGPILLAGEVKKGNQVVKLRDEKGMPLWRRSLKGR